jgi:hypothetical protein
MSSVIISGDTSGAITVSAPAVAGTNTLTLQAATATNSVNTLGTAVASTSGTSIDFTGIPSWVKRITVMLSGVSTSSTSNPQIQLGAGSVTTSGYLGTGSNFASGVATSNYTTGFGIWASANWLAANVVSGGLVITNITGNTWVAFGSWGISNSNGVGTTAGNIALSGTLDRVRITTVNGTDTFDAGSINILYEG